MDTIPECVMSVIPKTLVNTEEILKVIRHALANDGSVKYTIDRYIKVDNS